MPVTGVHISAQAYAEETGVDAETVRARLRDLGAQPSGEFRGFALYRLRDLHRALMSAAGGHVDPDKLPPFQRHAYYKAERERLNLQVEQRELIPVIEVERDSANVYKLVAQTLDTLPDVLERDCALTPDVVARIEAALDGARNELRAAIARLAERPPEVAE
jgi:hypothetical protein